MEQIRKIFVFTPPTTGHVNPMCSLVYELSRRRDFRVIFYSEETYRECIEASGAQFRPYVHSNKNSPKAFQALQITKKRITIGLILNEFLTWSFDQLPRLLHDVRQEQPDLILYDNIFLPIKYLIEVIHKQVDSGEWTWKVPKFVAFFPNFPINDKMVKTIRKHSKETFWSMFPLVNAFRRQALLSFRHRIFVFNPVSVMMAVNSNLNIVAILPDLQPYRDEFNSSFKFVGPCVSKEARQYEIKVYYKAKIPKKNLEFSRIWFKKV